MVEIGWTDVRLFSSGWEIESGPSSMLVNPGMPITFGAMAVYHITQDMAETGRDPDDVRKVILIEVDVACSHNWQFDSRFIKTTKPAICTLKCAKAVWPDLESYSNGAIRYAKGLCLNDERTMPSHRAGPDTWVTAHILLELLKERTLEELLEISANPLLLLKMPFGKHRGVPFSQIDAGYLDWLALKSDMRNDPEKEDVVYTSRRELERRGLLSSLEGAPGF
jgi:exodeoxyribonuclease X